MPLHLEVLDNTEPSQPDNEVWTYLLKDCADYRLPFIIENSHSDREDLEEWNCWILVTKVTKVVDKAQFDCEYVVLKGKHFGKVTVSKTCVWKFCRNTLQISNKFQK